MVVFLHLCFQMFTLLSRWWCAVIILFLSFLHHQWVFSTLALRWFFWECCGVWRNPTCGSSVAPLHASTIVAKGTVWRGKCCLVEPKFECRKELEMWEKLIYVGARRDTGCWDDQSWPRLEGKMGYIDSWDARRHAWGPAGALFKAGGRGGARTELWTSELLPFHH